MILREFGWTARFAAGSLPAPSPPPSFELNSRESGSAAPSPTLAPPLRIMGGERAGADFLHATTLWSNSRKNKGEPKQDGDTRLNRQPWFCGIPQTASWKWIAREQGWWSRDGGREAISRGRGERRAYSSNNPAAVKYSPQAES